MKDQKKPKLLLILHLPPPLHGSAVVGNQIKNSFLINDKFLCEYINLSTSRSLEEIGRTGLKKFILYFTILFRVFRCLLFNRYDLCYIAITSKGIAFYKDFVVCVLVKIFRTRIIYHMHNKGVRLREDKLFDNFLYKVTFFNSNVILLSDLLFSDIKKYVNKERTFVCPNGICAPSDNFSRIENEGDFVKILFLSNLIESKGIFVLLNSCLVLKQKGLSFKCYIIGKEGDISSGQLLAQIKALKIEDYIEYLGFKFGDEKNSWFKEADIFTFPTYNDCFPLVLLEAMSFGLPVVSTFEGGIPDIVVNEETGFLVPSKSEFELAEKIEILIRNPYLRKTMGDAGRKRYLTKFTYNQFETRFVNILAGLVDDIS